MNFPLNDILERTDDVLTLSKGANPEVVAPAPATPLLNGSQATPMADSGGVASLFVTGLVLHKDDVLQLVRVYVPQAIGIRQLDAASFVVDLPHSTHH